MTTPPSPAGVPGYLRPLKTLAVTAVIQAFDIQYPILDSSGGTQNVNCSLDYPVNQAFYPGIWVTYAPAQLQNAGINYTEQDAAGNTYVRWRFSGTISFTVVALTNNERDLLYDQLLSIIAFAAQSDATSAFRNFIEASPLIESTWSYDSVESAGHGESLGTPWGTDEVIYEDGISIQVTGEFTVNPSTGQLVTQTLLSKFDVTAYPVIGGQVQAPEWEVKIAQASQKLSGL